MRPLKYVAEAIVVVSFSVFLGGCDGLVRVNGVVRDSRGEPIAGAKIHVTSMDQYWRAEWGANGCFYVGGTSDPMHSTEPLTVVAPGYKSASAKVRTGAIYNQVIVILVPSNSAAVSKTRLLAASEAKELTPCDKSNEPSRPSDAPAHD